MEGIPGCVPWKSVCGAQHNTMQERCIIINIIILIDDQVFKLNNAQPEVLLESAAILAQLLQETVQLIPLL